MSYDAEAVYHLARYWRGASDANPEIIKRAFPDCPVDGRESREAVREWLRAHPDILIAVAKTDPTRPPDAGPKSRWTVAELLAAKFPEPNWIIPGILVEGLTILAGRPKIGKSWLCLQLAGAVGTGGIVLGKEVKRAKVVYYALEDTPLRIQSRIKTQLWPDDTDVEFEFADIDLATDEGVSTLEKECQEGARLIIVDTIGRAARFDQGDYQETVDVIGRLQRVAATWRVGIVCVDHHRKASASVADLVDDIIESTGKSGTADTIIGLYRQRGQHTATLRIVGREVEEQNLAVEWDPVTCTWQLLGDEQQVARSRLCQEIIGALQALGGEATTTDIAEHLGMDKGNVSRGLAELVQAGRVVRGERQGRTVLYRLLED